MGPLSGVRIVELGNIGPSSFAAMMLADAGADVVSLDRPERTGGVFRPDTDPLRRGRWSVGIDLKQPGGADVVLRLVEQADGFVEGFRPGVAERLGVGPDECLARNPRLVYGRLTGWGQDGPYAGRPGHDVNYVALAGAVDPIGPADGNPVIPLNLVGFGGAAVFAFGMVCALLEAARSGTGQVVDGAVVEGASLLAAPVHGLRAAGDWRERRAANVVDGGAPFYSLYETADGRHVAVAAVEPHFYAALLSQVGLDDEDPARQRDEADWPRLRERLAAVFRTRPRDAWCEDPGGADACISPVLTLGEVADHEHLRARQAFVTVGGGLQPAPAPRYGRTPAGPPRPSPGIGDDTDEALAGWGFATAEIAELRRRKVIA